MEVVLVVGGYYPNFSATGNCIGKIASELQKYYSIRVISELKSLTDTKTEKWENQFITRVSTTRIHQRLNLKQKQSRFLLFLHKSYYFVKFLFNRYGLDMMLVKEYYKALSNYNAKKSIDVIISCCMPIESVYATYLFSLKHRKIKNYPILFDLYADSDIFFRNKIIKRIKRKPATIMQKSIIQKATGIFYVDNWIEFFKKDPCTKAYYIEHPLVNRMTAPKKSLRNKKKIGLIYQGEVNYEIRNPTKALSVLKEIINRDNEDEISIHFFSFGNANGEIKKMSDEYKKNVFMCGKVLKSEADSFSQDADINIVFANKDSQIIPSKIYECISSGKPLLYFTENCHDYSCNVLQKYNNKLIIDLGSSVYPDVGSIISWIKKNYNRIIRFEELDHSYYAASSENVANTIRGVITRDEYEGNTIN